MTPRRIIDPARLAGSAILRAQSDERLVDLTRAGNVAAFEAIVRRYRPELLRYCGRLLPASRIEDAVQQTFLSAHKALASGSAEISLRAWLYRIAHNHAVSLLRQNGWDNEPITEEAAGLDDPLDVVHDRREDLRDAVAAVAGLPDRQREALVLREVEGRPYDEIAAQLGVSGGAVRQLVLRARLTLRAGASALTPPWIFLRLTENASAAGASSIATVAAGTAGGAGLAKAGAAIVAAVAIAAGTGEVASDGTARARPDRAPAPSVELGSALDPTPALAAAATRVVDDASPKRAERNRAAREERAEDAARKRSGEAADAQRDERSAARRDGELQPTAGDETGGSDARGDGRDSDAAEGGDADDGSGGSDSGGDDDADKDDSRDDDGDSRDADGDADGDDGGDDTPDGGGGSGGSGSGGDSRDSGDDGDSADDEDADRDPADD